MLISIKHNVFSSLFYNKVSRFTQVFLNTDKHIKKEWSICFPLPVEFTFEFFPAASCLMLRTHTKNGRTLTPRCLAELPCSPKCLSSISADWSTAESFDPWLKADCISSHCRQKPDVSKGLWHFGCDSLSWPISSDKNPDWSVSRHLPFRCTMLLLH